MAVAGGVWVIYGWYEGLETWVVIPEGGPMQVPLDTVLSLSIGWQNVGDQTFAGHVALSITKPDGTTLTPAAESGQDSTEDPTGTAFVTFAGFTTDQVGQYVAFIELSDVPTGIVLDRIETWPVAVATVPEDATTVVMGYMMVMMVMGMMMQMSQGMTKK